MLTERDRKILIFIERFKCITIQQAAKMFFSDSKHSYDLARKRLKKIEEMNCIKHSSNTVTMERVYYTDTKPTPHTLYLLNFYTELVSKGCKVIDFKREPHYMNIVPDAFIHFEYSGKEKIAFIEIDLTHKSDLKRYEELFMYGQLQDDYGTFPIVISISDTDTERYRSKNFKIIYMDFDMKDINSVLL